MVDEVILRCAPLVCASHVLTRCITLLNVSSCVFEYFETSVLVRITSYWCGDPHNWILVVSDTELRWENCV